MLVVCDNWSVNLERFDLQCSVSTMRRYNSEPRKGNIGTTLRIFGYLKHHMKCRIIFDKKLWRIKERLI